MAVVGKRLTAVLYRTQSGAEDPAVFQYKLLWTDIDYGTPAQIAGYYPDLSWDLDQRVGRSAIIQFWGGEPIAEWLADHGYADDEAAVLDRQNYLENVVSPAGGYIAPSSTYYIMNLEGSWAPLGTKPSTIDSGGFEHGWPIMSGDPDSVWAQYPEANTYNVTVPTPFGDFGNGTIYDQAVYWTQSLPGGLTSGPWSGTQFSESPGADTIPPVTVVGFEVTYIFTPIVDDTGGGSDIYIDGVGDGLTDVTTTIRCWAFTLDGHDFYVMRLGPSTTLVYDRLTQQWSEWISPGRTNWRPICGLNWQGATHAFEEGYAADIICGDDASGALFFLDPTRGRDDRSDQFLGEDDKFDRIITAAVPLDGRTPLQCNALQIEVALGAPSQDSAAFSLTTSDDLGQTWINQGSVTTTTNDFTEVIEWRGLGMARQPGRLFRITDNGATVRIGRAELR